MKKDKIKMIIGFICWWTVYRLPASWWMPGGALSFCLPYIGYCSFVSGWIDMENKKA